MRNTILKAFTLFIVVCLLSGLCACNFALSAGYKEVDTLQLVQTFGIDSENEKFKITISTGAALQNQPAVVISRPAESLILSDEAIQRFSPKEELYFAHTRYVLLGEEAAETRFADVLDYLARSSKFRTDMPILVVKNDSAETLITGATAKKADITQSLSSVESDIKSRGAAVAYTCREIIRSLSEYGSALICAVTPSATEGSVFTETGDLTATAEGYGILREDALVAYLDKDEAWGATLLMGNAGYSPMSLKTDQGDTVSLHTEGGTAEFEALWNADGSLEEIQVVVEISGVLVEVGDALKPDKTEFLNEVTQAFNDEVRARCEGALTASQELEADFLGLMGYLRQKHTKEVFALGDKFVSELANTEIVVNVKGEVLSSFDLEGIDQAVGGSEESD